MKSVTIVGGGLAGSLMALFLANRGYQIDIFESRTDLRLSKQDFGRSINMALSCRGITSLKSIGLMSEVKPLMVPMRARAIYELDGTVKYQPFGRHWDEYINAIKRSELNRLLLNCIDKNNTININFKQTLVDIDFNKKQCIFEQDGTKQRINYTLLIGADGASSKVRECLQQQGHIEASRDFLPHSYKELSICLAGENILAEERLHMWPRDSFMLLGNPNPDSSITGSLFLPNEGVYSFASLKDESDVKHFFSEQFSDIYPHMPNVVQEFFDHPQGHLSTVKCDPWYCGDNCLLIGDAAHGLVPFFGQGMNSAFEDCRILNELLEQHDDQWEIVLPKFYQERKPNTDAVAAMSMDNYYEIRHAVLEPQFLVRKALENELMRRYPDQYISRHVMVMFTNLPYKAAYEQARIQGKILDQLCENKTSLAQIDWRTVDGLIENNVLNTYKLIEQTLEEE